MSHRVQQVNSLIQEKLGMFLLEHFEPPAGGLVTITKVETLPDFSRAKVKVSILPESQRGSILERLRQIAPEARRTLASEVTFFRMPQLAFEIDTIEASAVDIERLLDTISEPHVDSNSANFKDSQDPPTA